MRPAERKKGVGKMKLAASEWKKIAEVADLMQQLFSMPEESMRDSTANNT